MASAISNLPRLLSRRHVFRSAFEIAGHFRQQCAHRAYLSWGNHMEQPRVDHVGFGAQLGQDFDRSGQKMKLPDAPVALRSEEHTSELQSLMRISYAVFCLKKKKNQKPNTSHVTQ